MVELDTCRDGSGRADQGSAFPDAEQSTLIDLAANWVRTNCPNPAVCRDFVQRVHEAEERHVNCSFAIGPALTRTGAPYFAPCYSGQLFVFALTPSQARHLHAVGAQMQYAEHLRRQDTDPAFPVYVMLDELEIKNAAHLSNAEPIEGRCTYSLRGFWLEPFAFGLQFVLTGRADVCAWDHRVEGFIEADGLLRFSFSPIRKICGQASEVWTGTTAVMLRLYTAPNEGTLEGRQPFSNACAALIDVP